jgi:hypothetical protein
MFWKNSPKSQKRPKNKRFSRWPKKAESVGREEGNPLETADPQCSAYAIHG